MDIEKEYVDFISTLSSKYAPLKELLLSSPFGCRNPEVDKLLLKKFNIVSLFVYCLISILCLVSSPFYAMIKLCVKGNKIYYKKQGRGDTCIIASYSLKQQGIKKYLSDSDIKSSARFDFSYYKSEGMIEKRYLSFYKTVNILFKLNLLGLFYFKYITLNMSGLLRFIIIINYLTYVNRLSWSAHYNLKMLIEEFFEGSDYNAVYYPHEMFSESITIWKCCESLAIKTIAIQHTTISRGKLYYFRDKKEWALDLKGPDIFIVSTQSDLDILSEFYPESTKFIINGTPRLNSQYLNKRKKNQDPNGVLLISTGTWYEVEEILLFALKILRAQEFNGDIYIRLHPDTKLTQLNKLILFFLNIFSRVKLDYECLEVQLGKISTVFGCGTSLLYELALSGENVKIISNEKYYSYHDENKFLKNAVVQDFDVSSLVFSKSLTKAAISDLTMKYNKQRNETPIFEMINNEF